MSEFNAGDRVRIKDRSDWYLPTGYKLANQTGSVFEIMEEPEGYVMVLLDSDEISGIDKSIPLAFRIESLEKV
jgi:hypothetical protein